MDASLAAEVPDLRERRRQATLQEIANVALELFERQGVAATTVDEIARQAGVSPRTFFRYFPSKERAVLEDDGLVDPVLNEALDAIGSGAVPIVALDRAWLHVVSGLEQDAQRRERYLRVRRLIAAEPTLVTASLAVDMERAEAMTTRLIEASKQREKYLPARATAELIGSIVRLSFEEWARLADAGQPTSFTAIYERVREAFLADATTLARSTRADGKETAP